MSHTSALHSGRTDVTLLFRYTRNGELLGDGFVPVYETNLVPVVGFHSNGESVRVNFGLVPFAYEVRRKYVHRTGTGGDDPTDLHLHQGRGGLQNMLGLFFTAQYLEVVPGRVSETPEVLPIVLTLRLSA